MIKKRKALFVFLSLALIFSSILVVKYYPTRNISKTGETSPQRLTYPEIAKKVLGCIDKNLRDETGGYIAFQRCSPSSCEDGPFDGRVELYALWARGKYLEKYSDQEERKIFDQDLDYYVDYLNRGVIMPDFWGRNLLYEIWRGKNITPEEKEKIEKLAINIDMGEGSYDFVEVTKLLRKGDFQPQPLAEVLAASPVKKLTNNDLLKAKFKVGLGYALDFLDYYRWKGSEDALKTSREFFNMAVRRYLSSKEISLENSCVLGLTSAEIFLRLGEKDYQDFSLAVFKDQKEKMKCLSEKECVLPLETSTLCGLYLRRLNQIAGIEESGEMAGELMQKLIDQNFDYLSYPGDLLGSGCFAENRGGGEFSLKSNSLLIGFLLENEE